MNMPPGTRVNLQDSFCSIAVNNLDNDLFKADRKLDRRHLGAAIRAARFSGQVALTANAMQHDEEIYRAAGFTDFLAKPIEPAQLYRVLDKFLALALPPQEQTHAALFSNVEEDDAVILNVVKNFVAKLPVQFAELTRVIEWRDWQAMRDVVRALKGLGGSMGYPLVSEVATAMHVQIESENLAGIQQL